MYDEAIKDFDESLNLEKNAYSFKTRGEIYYNAGQCERALKDFDESLHYDTKDPWVFEMKGDCYTALEKYDLAIECFTKSIDLQPSSYAYQRRGECLCLIHQFEDSIRDFTTVVERDDSATGLAHRADCYRLMGNFPAAIRDATGAIKKDPQTELGGQVLAYTYLTMEQYHKALYAINATLAIHPDSAISLMIRARILLSLKQFCGYQDLLRVQLQLTEGEEEVAGFNVEDMIFDTLNSFDDFQQLHQ